MGYTTTEKSFEMNGRDPVELQCEIEQCVEDLANKLVSGARCFTFPCIESSSQHAQHGDSVYMWEVAKVHNPRQNKAEDWVRLPGFVVYPVERVLCHHAWQPEAQKRQRSSRVVWCKCCFAMAVFQLPLTRKAGLL